MTMWGCCYCIGILVDQSPAAVAGIIKSGKTAQKDPKEMVTEAAEGHDQQMNPAEQETFFLTGVLDELKFIVSNSLDVW
jgi:hypothetical protein